MFKKRLDKVAVIVDLLNLHQTDEIVASKI